MGTPRVPDEAVDPTWLAALEVFAAMQFVVFTRILFRASDLDNARAILDRIGSGTRDLINAATQRLTRLAAVTSTRACTESAHAHTRRA
jgi:hypothetical protein